MRRSRELLAIAFVATGVAAAASFGAATGWRAFSKGSQPARITFIRMKEGGQFWSSMRNGAREARTDTRSAVDFYSSVKASDVSMQIEYIDKAIEKGTDCIVITPCAYYLLQKPLEKAERAGIKIVSLFNEYDRGEGSSAVFFQTELHPAGKAVAERVLGDCGGPVNALIVGSFDSITSERYLAEGFSRAIEKDPLAKSRVLYAGRDIESIGNQIRASYEQDDGINVVFALNDEISEGMIKAMTEISPRKKIVVIASSNSLINIESLETGAVDYILVINSFGMGYRSIGAAVELSRGKNVEDVPVDFTVVSKENMFDVDVQKKLFPLP